MDHGDFAHHRLDVYDVALELAVVARAIADDLLYRDRRIADQLTRASPAIVLLLAEGASRRKPKGKRQRYEEALGETGEVAAALELVHRLGLTDAERVARAVRLADRVARMLSKLVARFSQ